MKKKVHITREKKKGQGTNRVEITGIVMILLGFFVCLSLGGYVIKEATEKLLPAGSI